jgi:hypothetical protein
MQEKIGTTAGTIWQALNAKGELTLEQLNGEVKGKVPIFGWAIGWLAREGKIVITPERHSFRVRLTEAQAKAAAAAAP